MLVMYGDNNTVVLAIVEADIETLHAGRTLEYIGFRMLAKDIIVMYGRDKQHVIDQVRAAGIPVSEEMQRKYLAGERTDHPVKPS